MASRAFSGRPTAPDYPRIFNRLCHLLALTRDGKIPEVCDNVVIATFALHKEGGLHNAAEVAAAVRTTFGIDLRVPIVQSSISRLETAQKLRRLPNSKVLFIDAATQAQVDQRAATAGDLERAVRDEWIGSIKTLKALDAAERQRQWLCLQEYLVRLLDRHGAETVQLLAPNGMRNPSLNKSIHSLRGEAFTAAQVTEAEKVIAEEATQAFFRDISPLRARYIAQLLDGMFSYFALSVDQATTAFLRKNLQRIRLFLDSNFILGILGLSSNFLVDVSQELLTLIKDQKLPFELYFHDETIKEIERVVYGIGRSLKAEAWTGEMSRAFVESGKLGLLLAFRRFNLMHQITAMP